MTAAELLVGVPYWCTGECFKCDRCDVPVTHYGAMEGSRGVVELFVCRGCTVRLEMRYRGLARTALVPLSAPHCADDALAAWLDANPL